jgi:hypothetical protein
MSAPSLAAKRALTIMVVDAKINLRVSRLWPLTPQNSFQ